VESKCARFLWDATVIGVSHRDGKVNGYRVHYNEWSSRFDEWVEPMRVVEPNENNVQVQVGLVGNIPAACIDTHVDISHRRNDAKSMEFQGVTGFLSFWNRCRPGDS